MYIPWIADDCHKQVAIVGVCKNAGKTTLLNAVMQQHNSIKWGVMSTGRDGEHEDVLYKTPKPSVEIAMGSMFCSYASVINDHGSNVSILKKTRWLSGGKPIWIAKAEQDIHTEICGPQSVKDLAACALLLLSLGAEKIIIDGSLDRKSIVLSDSLDAIILVIGAGFGDMKSINTELKRLLSLAAIPVAVGLGTDVTKRLLEGESIKLNQDKRWVNTGFKSLIGNEKSIIELIVEAVNPSALYIPGAYTSAVNARLADAISNLQVVVRNPECIKLSDVELSSFIANRSPQCLIPLKIKAIAINANAIGAASIDADLLRNSLRKDFPKLELIDLMEV
jgi:hypothetical protein